MLRLIKRMEDGSYQYKNMIIERCGKLEDLLGIIVCNIMEGMDSRNLKIKLYDELKKRTILFKK